jgi:hypothetical protein
MCTIQLKKIIEVKFCVNSYTTGSKIEIKLVCIKFLKFSSQLTDFSKNLAKLVEFTLGGKKKRLKFFVEKMTKISCKKSLHWGAILLHASWDGSMMG